MAATVSLELLLETARAEEESEKTRKKLIADFNAAAKAGTQGFKEFAQKSAQELQDLSNIAKQNADKAARETAAKWKGVASNAIGIFGDLKDMFGMVGGAALGMSDNTFKAVEAAADLAEKGAMIGMSFGPLGAIIGGVSGALVSLAKDARDAKPALDELFKGREGLFSTGAVGAGAEIIWDQIFGNTEDLDEKEKKVVAALKRKKEIDADVAESMKKSVEQKKLYAEMGDDFSGPVVTANMDKQIKNRQALAKLNEDEAKKQKDAAVKAQEEEGKAVVAQMKKDYAAKEKEAKDYAAKWLKINEAFIVQANLERDAELAIKDEIYNAELRLFDLKDELRQQDLILTQEKLAAERALYEQNVASITAAIQTFGPLYSSLTDTISENITANQKAFSGLGAAAKKGVADVLKNLGHQWAIEGLGEAAKALAALGAGDLKGAGFHGAAAVALGVAAAAAGVGSARLGRTREGGASAGGGGSEGLGRSSTTSPPTQNLSPIVVNFNSTIPYTQREAQEAANRIADLNSQSRPRL